MNETQFDKLFSHMLCTASLIDWIAQGCPESNRPHVEWSGELWGRHFPIEGGTLELDNVRRRLKAFLSEAIERL